MWRYAVACTVIVGLLVGPPLAIALVYREAGATLAMVVHALGWVTQCYGTGPLLAEWCERDRSQKDV